MLIISSLYSILAHGGLHRNVLLSESRAIGYHLFNLGKQVLAQPNHMGFRAGKCRSTKEWKCEIILKSEGLLNIYLLKTPLSLTSLRFDFAPVTN